MREKFAVFVMVLLMVSMAFFVSPPVEREAEGVTPRQSYDIQGSGGDFLGTDIVLADIDNDGNDEVIVSEYQYDGTFSNTGAIYIYELSNLLLAPKIISPDQQTNERFGISISVGDVNGDGYLDIAGGAYMYDTTTSTNAGRVYLYYYSAIGPSSTWMWSSTGDDVANAYFGQRVLIEDINMDGYDDVIVSAPRYNPGGSSYQGKLYIYYGSSSGPSTTPSWTYTPSVSNSYYGEGIAVGDYDGDSYPELAVTNRSYVDIFNCNSSGPESTPSWRLYTGSSRDIVMGDVNGDGKDDLLCGNNVYTSGGYTGRGRAVLYFGGKSEGSYTTPDWSVVGEAQTYANFGYTVGMGDFNGDGYDDAVISSIQYDAAYVDQGKVYVYLSNGTNLQTTPEWTMLGTGSYTYLGWALLKNGRDVSGDGIDDVVITETGWNSNNGRVIFYYGTFVSTNISWKSTGPHQTGARFGYSLASGDFDGDGYKDLAIGAPYYDGANNDMGRVLVYNGSSGGLTSSPVWAQSPLNQLGAEFGYSLATGDFNGDGYDDLAVGAPYYDTSNTDAGRVLIYYGSSSGLATTVGASFSGPDQANANFGYTLSSGDYNGDGYDDLLVGAPWYDTISYTDAGAVYLYWGTPWGLASSYSHSYYGYQSSQSFGYSIATGDMYGDGIDDFAIGIPYEDYGGNTNCGGVRVYSGSTGGTPHQRYVFHGSYNNELFGNSITFGDFNGDGSDGLAVAAPLYSSGGTIYGRISVYRGTRYGLYYSFYILNRDSREYGVESISAGDIDGDGLEDLVVGSCLDDAPTYSRSAIYVHRGRSGSQPLLPDYSWRYRTATYNGLGYSTLSDDFNGDDLCEIVGGAPYDNLSMGIVYVWNGQETSRPYPPSYWRYSSPYGEEGVAVIYFYQSSSMDVVGYQLYMSMNRTGPWTLKATVNNTANYFQVGSLTDGVTYYFKIRAYDEVPNYSDYTTVFSVVTVDTKPPNPPGNLKASPTSSGYIRLTWTPSNSSDVQGYVIYRTGEGGSGNYNEIARVSSATTSYVDNNVSVGRMYFYQVAAYDEVPNYSTSPEPVGMVADYDYDGDGIGDSFDRDDDNDGVEDLRDAFPYNSAEWADYDGDGIGDNADTDDDNDGIPDSSDAWPLLDINDIEATVDTIEQKIDNLNMTLEEVLDRVKDLQNDYSYFNTSAVALFDELFHRLSRLEANLTSKLEMVEGNLTSKINGMNSTILAELQNVMDRIDSMDGSLRALIESMWADYNTTSASDTQSIINAVNAMWAGLNATHSADLATLIGKIEEMWSGINDTHDEDLRTLLEKIEEMWSGINDTHDEDLKTLLEKIEEMWNGINDTHARDLATLLLRIEELQAYLDGRLNLTREELINKTEEMWDSFNQTLSYVLNTIQTRLNELEGNMEDNFTAMREYIALRMDQLTIYLGIINATLHYHLSEIEDEMEEFREVTLENLTAIMGYLHDLWQNNTEGREEILNAIEASNELMRNLNTQSMNELRMRLTEIMVYLEGFNTSEGRRHAEMLQSLINKLDKVNGSVQSHLDDIDATLVALQKLDRIIGDIENVDKRVVESKKDLKENDGTIKLYNLILIILLLVVIVLEVLIYMKKGEEGETKVIEREVIKEVGGGKGGEKEEVIEEGEELWEEEELEEG